MNISFIGACNHTGIGHHATGLACALNAVTDLEYQPLYIDHGFRAEISKRAGLQGMSTMDPARATFIFDSPIPSTWWRSGAKRILLLPFETTHPIPEPEKVFHAADFVGTFGSWGIEVLKEYLPEEKLFQVPYAATLGGEGLYLDLFDAKPNPRVLQSLSGMEPAELTFSMMAKAELRKCIDLILDQMPRLGVRHDLFWFGTDAGVGLRAPSIMKLVTERYHYKVVPPKSEFVHSVLKRGSSRIFLVKMLALKDLWRYASASQYFLAFSRGEGWGIPAYEALALGMRVIGSKVGNQAEFLNERTGVVLKPQSKIRAVDSWTGFIYPGQAPEYYNYISILPAIEEALELQDWEKKQEEAKRLTRRYSWEDVGKRLLEIAQQGGALDGDYRRSWYA